LTAADPMNDQLVIDLTRNAITTALTIAAPMLVIALGIGLLVSVVQSVTQIQEQTLAFVPKLILVGGAFIVGLPWIIHVLTQYTRELFLSIPSVVA
jgi:flagellar biosynthesis protein FliQ